MGIEKFRRKVVGTKADFTEQIVCVKGALAVTATPYTLLNPLGVALIVTKVVVDITSAVSATPVTMDVGVGAATNTDYDTLIDGVVIGTPTAIGVYDNEDDKGTNGKATNKWGATEYLNVYTSAAPTGLAGSIYIWYRKA